MNITETLRGDLTIAMKARDTLQSTVLRGLLSAFTNESITLKRKPEEPLSDEEALKVLKRAANQRKDSIEQFEKGGREDLAIKEKEELAIIETYLPEMMSKEAIQKAAEEKKEALGITDVSGKGQLMGALMKDLGSKADGKDVKDVVDSLFS